MDSDKENEFSIEKTNKPSGRQLLDDEPSLEEYDMDLEYPEMILDSDNFMDRVITPVEMGIINQYLFDTYKTKANNGVTVECFGGLYNKKLFMNGTFENSRGWWFQINLDSEPNNRIYLQTNSYFDRNDRYVTELSLTCEKTLPIDKLKDLISEIQKTAFNNSRFKGKCLEVEIRNGMFEGIQVIEVKDVVNDLILGESQEKFMKHFIKRLKRGRSMRILRTRYW